jgi:hypothetical protein
MTLEEIRARVAKHNAAVRELKAAGFVYCTGEIYFGDSFDQKTCTWQPNSRRIGKLVREGDEWVVKPYEGFAHLLEGVCGFTQNGGGKSDEP